MAEVTFNPGRNITAKSVAGWRRLGTDCPTGIPSTHDKRGETVQEIHDRKQYLKENFQCDFLESIPSKQYVQI